MNTIDFPHIPASRRSLSLRSPLFGVGINNAEYLTSLTRKGQRLVCPFYARWRGILQRACCPKFHALQPSYADSTVCAEWVEFSGFRAWMESQDWQGMELDKDLLIEGNKRYGPEACAFITKRTNVLLTDRAADRGKWPIGVTFEKDTKKFKAHCNDGSGRMKNLGRFATPEAAHLAWRLAKSKVIIEVAQSQPDPRVRDALLKRAAILQGCPR